MHIAVDIRNWILKFALDYCIYYLCCDKELNSASCVLWVDKLDNLIIPPGPTLHTAGGYNKDWKTPLY